MVYFLLILLAFAVVFATAAWIMRRPEKWLFPSDIFFILCLLTAGIVPFVNLHADSQFAVPTNFSDTDISRVLIALSIMFFTFGSLWLLRPKLKIPDLVYVGPPLGQQQRKLSERRSNQFFWLSAALIFGLSFVLLLYPPYFVYKLQVTEFLLGQINENDYQLARRVTFADNNFIIGFVGRLRFAIYPMAFVATALLALRRGGLASGILVAALAFVAGPASFSKAPVVIFLAYFVIAVMLTKGVRRPFTAQTAIIGIGVALGLLLVLLTGIYFLQYGEQLRGPDAIPRAFSLAFFRVFVATYGGLLQYISTFPNGDVGVAASVIAPIFGVQTRALDQEVAIAYLGPVIGLLTTFPTIFIGNAYATFGFLGVFIFTVAVTLIIFAVDYILTQLRSPLIRTIYYSIMIVQVNFFATLSAPTTLVTYGIIVIPLSLFMLDRFIMPRNLSSRRFVRARQSDPRGVARR